MYNTFFFALFLAFWGNTSIIPVTSISLDEAVRQKLVSVRWEYNPEGTHYTNPLKLNIKNLQTQPLQVTLANGWLLTPEDSIYQTLVTTRTIVMALKPNQQLRYAVPAMCTEPHDRGPNEQSQYRLGEKGNENLEKLTMLIGQRRYNNGQGQSAIWALTADYPLEGVNGFQVACRDSLLDALCALTGKKRPTLANLNDYRYNPSSNQMKVAVSGRLNFSLFKDATVLVGLFNKHNVQVRELYYKAQAPEGEHSVFYEFDSTVYTDDYYYVKTIVNEKVLFDRKFEMKR
jgi:hypothetical protein